MGFNWGGFGQGFTKTYDAKAVGGAINQTMLNSGIQEAEDKYSEAKNEANTKLLNTTDNGKELNGNARPEGGQAKMLSKEQLEKMTPEQQEYFNNYYEQQKTAGNTPTYKYDDQTRSKMLSDAADERDAAIKKSYIKWRSPEEYNRYQKSEAEGAQARLAKYAADGLMGLKKQLNDMSDNPELLLQAAKQHGMIDSNASYDKKTNSIITFDKKGNAVSQPVTRDMMNSVMEKVEFQGLRNVATNAREYIEALNYEKGARTKEAVIENENLQPSVTRQNMWKQRQDVAQRGQELAHQKARLAWEQDKFAQEQAWIQKTWKAEYGAKIGDAAQQRRLEEAKLEETKRLNSANINRDEKKLNLEEARDNVDKTYKQDSIALKRAEGENQNSYWQGLLEQGGQKIKQAADQFKASQDQAMAIHKDNLGLGYDKLLQNYGIHQDMMDYRNKSLAQDMAQFSQTLDQNRSFHDEKMKISQGELDNKRAQTAIDAQRVGGQLARWENMSKAEKAKANMEALNATEGTAPADGTAADRAAKGGKGASGNTATGPVMKTDSDGKSLYADNIRVASKVGGYTFDAAYDIDENSSPAEISAAMAQQQQDIMNAFSYASRDGYQTRMVGPIVQIQVNGYWYTAGEFGKMIRQGNSGTGGRQDPAKTAAQNGLSSVLQKSSRFGGF